MENQPLCFKKVRKGAYTPTKDTKDSVGYDIKSPSAYVIKSKTTGVVPTGLAFDIPRGQYGRLATKSHQAWEYSLLVLGGVIDPGYTREVFVILHVLGEKDFDIGEGEDFIQLIIEKNSTSELQEVKELPLPTKQIKHYDTQVQKPAERSTQTRSTGRISLQHPKKYRLREKKTKRQTIRSICKHCK